MAWRKGLLPLWAVGSAIWIVTVVVLMFHYAAQDPHVSGIALPDRAFVASIVVRAAELYEDYSYYKLIRPDLVVKKRQLFRDFNDPKSPHYCMSPETWDREKAELAELEAKEAKRPPLAPPPQRSPIETLRAFDRVMRVVEGTAKEPAAEEAGTASYGRETNERESRPLSLADLYRMEMTRGPECSAKVERAKRELEDVVDLDDVPDWVRDALLSLAYLLFGPPIAALVIGTSLIWGFGWAFRGFRAR